MGIDQSIVTASAPLVAPATAWERLRSGWAGSIWASEWKPLALLATGFLLLICLPVERPRVQGAVLESLHLAKWYAREHVISCLVPAFFIAGAIGVFVSQAAVMRYLGARASKPLAYGVASVSGTVLAVCSCTVLPLFAGIYRMGAGLGPATAFLYAGPAINVLAIILTARVLGLELGIARAVGAVAFSVVIGVMMHLIYRREELERTAAQAVTPAPETSRPLWQNGIYFGAMIGILVFANWARPADPAGLWFEIYSSKWAITAAFSAVLAFVLVRWIGVRMWKIAALTVAVAGAAWLAPAQPLAAFVIGIVGLSVITSTSEGEAGEWFGASWEFAKQIVPLLLIGVLVAGFLLGRPGHEGLIPSEWIARSVGSNSLGANLFAAVAGAFMYFATLTEVPIVQGLIGSGMAKGPALALLLAGPALSLPSMLVIRSIMGTRKTVVFILLVITMATISGWVFGTVLG